MSKETLSPSATNTFLQCNRHYYYRYQVGLVPIESAQPLRFGSAFHRALAARATGADYEAALKAGIGDVQELDELDVAILAALLAGYFARYQTEIIKELHPEIEIRVPMAGNNSFEALCVLDGLATLVDGRVALCEHKTTSQSVEDGSPYWDEQKFNIQLMGYVEAARFKDWDIQVVLYDVIRKPSIRQKQTETVEQYADRLRADIAARPEFYFARKELSVLDGEIAEYQASRDAVARQITAARLAEKRYEKSEYAWPRCVGRFTCANCDCASFCLQGITANRENIPSGMKLKNS